MGNKVKFPGFPEYSSDCAGYYDSIRDVAKRCKLDAEYTMKALVKAASVKKVSPGKRGPRKKKKDVFNWED